MKEGKFILIVGKQRAGKTLLMANLVHNEYKKGREIFTNIEYSFDHTILFFEDLDLDDDEVVDRVRGSTVSLDEIWMLLDSRSSNSKPNKKASRWLYQVKKMGVDLYGTTHDLHLIDRRARENFDYLFEVEAFPEKRPEDVPPDYITVEITNGPLQRDFHKSMRMPVTPNKLNLYDNENIFDPLVKPNDYQGIKTGANQHSFDL